MSMIETTLMRVFIVPTAFFFLSLSSSFRTLCLMRTRMTSTNTTALNRTRARIGPRNMPKKTLMSLMKQLYGGRESI